MEYKQKTNRTGAGEVPAGMGARQRPAGAGT